jgi:hypothetical protein
VTATADPKECNTPVGLDMGESEPDYVAVESDRALKVADRQMSFKDGRGWNHRGPEKE